MIECLQYLWFDKKKYESVLMRSISMMLLVESVQIFICLRECNTAILTGALPSNFKKIYHLVRHKLPEIVQENLS